MMSSEPSLCGCQTYFLVEEILKTLRGASLASLEHYRSTNRERSAAGSGGGLQGNNQ